MYHSLATGVNSPELLLTLLTTISLTIETKHIQALDSPRALLQELQRIKDTVRCGALGAEVPGHRQEQLTQTLIVRLLKTHLFSFVKKFGIEKK